MRPCKQECCPASLALLSQCMCHLTFALMSYMDLRSRKSSGPFQSSSGCLESQPLLMVPFQAQLEVCSTLRSSPLAPTPLPSKEFLQQLLSLFLPLVHVLCSVLLMSVSHILPSSHKPCRDCGFPRVRTYGWLIFRSPDC